MTTHSSETDIEMVSRPVATVGEANRGQATAAPSDADHADHDGAAHDPLSAENRRSPSPLTGLRIHFATFGCQMNFLDSELALGALLDHGCLPADTEDDADVVIFNTCSVRQHAEDRVASRVGQLQFRARREPDFVVGMIGCMAQRDGKALLNRFPHLRFVAGTRAFQNLPQLLMQLRDQPAQQLLALDTEQIVNFNRRVALRPEWYRAQITVMRGCDHHCTFCIVPTVRGREQDVEPELILEEARRLVDDGVREITLLGQNVDSYGRRLEPRFKKSLADLLAEMDRDLGPRGLQRIFFITSHPSDLRLDLLHAMRDCPTVCEYLHLPVQSGSTRVLRDMRRGYSREKYLEVIAQVRSIVPDACIATDWILGFPGETDDDFAQSLSLLEEVGFTQSFIFKYSPRPGTRSAEKMVDDVPDAVKKSRNAALLAAQEDRARRLNQARIGSTVEVICEGVSKKDQTRYVGRTRGHQLAVWPANGECAVGDIVKLRVVDATALTLIADRADNT